MPRLRILLPAFFVCVFLLSYYDFYYIYLPVRTNLIMDDQPTLGGFILYNFSLKLIGYSFKFLLVSVLILTIIFFADKESTCMYRNLILVVVASEVVFLLLDTIRILYFTFWLPEYSEADYINFHPLSTLALLKVNTESNFYSLLKSFNLFELGYVLCVSFGLRVTNSTRHPQLVSISAWAIVLAASLGFSLIIK